MNPLGLILILSQIPPVPPASTVEARPKVLETSSSYQILDGSNQPKLEVQRRTAYAPGVSFQSRIVFTLPSGERYVLREFMNVNPTSYDDSLEFPGGQKVFLEGKSKEGTNRVEAALRFGKRRMAIDLNREAGGENAEFSTDDGQQFRNVLPPLPDELLDALGSLRRDDLVELGLTGTASTFFEAYRDRWLKPRDNPWQLKRMEVSPAP